MSQSEEDNKKIVLDYFTTAFHRLDFEGASKFFGPHYKQHNPTLADGWQGIKDFIELRKTKLVGATHEIKHVLADGDLVMVHVHYTPEPGTPGFAVVDIYRLENGKLVEHWDVIQEVPAKSVNENGMF